jgi:hypothetical protein
MNTMLFCLECDIEFRLKYEGDAGLFVPAFCPFCGEDLDPNEQYAVEEDLDEG